MQLCSWLKILNFTACNGPASMAYVAAAQSSLRIGTTASYNTKIALGCFIGCIPAVSCKHACVGVY